MTSPFSKTETFFKLDDHIMDLLRVPWLLPALTKLMSFAAKKPAGPAAPPSATSTTTTSTSSSLLPVHPPVQLVFGN